MFELIVFILLIVILWYLHMIAQQLAKLTGKPFSNPLIDLLINRMPPVSKPSKDSDSGEKKEKEEEKKLSN